MTNTTYTITTDAISCGVAASERITGIVTMADLASRYAAIDGAELRVSDAYGQLVRETPPVETIEEIEAQS